ncbi:MAG: efflux RND transporter permease subunit [Bdellovibrio sp.]|nr:efflux RND transporter permease subunit [Bdellovibrio sp.]
MTLSELSIKKPVFAWMLMAGLIIFGVLCFLRMGVSQLPDVDFPVVTVQVSLEGASPNVMEVDVVDPLESALMGVQGIIGITSSAELGQAKVTLEFDIGKNIDTAVQEIQTVVSRATRTLPKDINPPIITKSNPEDQPILWLSVSSSKMSKNELMAYVRDNIQDKFSTVEGVGEIHLGGFVDPNLRVWVSGGKLAEKDLAITDIINAIQSEHSEQPSGLLEGREKIFNVRTMGEAPTPEEFGKIIIGRRGGSINYNPIKLSEVATVEDGLADQFRITRVNNAPAVGIGIKKQRGANSVEIAKAVKAKITALKPTLPPGTEIGIRFDTTKFIEESIHELNFTLVLSAILTALVCWVFLGSFTATINVILAIPTSIVGSFICLYAFGFTLNSFTLLGLALAIGIVVDDAIMVLENIVRHRESGKKRRLAALEGSVEITFAALAATAAIIAIFLPIAFMKGIIGKFFYQFGVTISVAVVLSLLEALTLTPMRCSRFLEISEHRTFFGKWIERSFLGMASYYKKIIPYLIKFRWVTIILALVIFSSSMLFIKILPKEFAPAQDQGRIMLRLQTAVGSALDFTDTKVREVENLLKSKHDVEQFFTNIGGGSSGDSNSSMIFVTLKPLLEREIDSTTHKRLTQQEFAAKLRKELKEIKGIKVSIIDPSLAVFSSRGGYPITFSVKGPRWNNLIKYSELIMKEMSESSLMADVDSNYKSGMPEIHIIPNRVQAKEHGISVADISSTIKALVGGEVPGKFSKAGHRYDIRVSLIDAERSNPSDLMKLKVRNNRGELIPLAKVVTLKEEVAMQSISREDRTRAITVRANLGLNSSQELAMKRVHEIAAKILPENYYISMSGSSKTFNESKQNLIFALLLGVVIAYMILASQFNSFIHPITVLVALPFSLTGAFIGLYFFHQSLNIYSMIGIILLMGIVKKNSILLVDFTNQLRASGLPIKEALTEACPVRLRPILMTSISTIAAAVPPALAIGPGAESRIPMAIAVLGGVALSTLLTLFVVPCVYSVLSFFERPDKE